MSIQKHYLVIGLIIQRIFCIMYNMLTLGILDLYELVLCMWCWYVDAMIGWFCVITECLNLLCISIWLCYPLGRRCVSLHRYDHLVLLLWVHCSHTRFRWEHFSFAKSSRVCPQPHHISYISICFTIWGKYMYMYLSHFDELFSFEFTCISWQV